MCIYFLVFTLLTYFGGEGNELLLKRAVIMKKTILRTRRAYEAEPGMARI